MHKKIMHFVKKDYKLVQLCFMMLVTWYIWTQHVYVIVMDNGFYIILALCERVRIIHDVWFTFSEGNALSSSSTAAPHHAIKLLSISITIIFFCCRAILLYIATYTEHATLFSFLSLAIIVIPILSENVTCVIIMHSICTSFHYSHYQL